MKLIKKFKEHCNKKNKCTNEGHMIYNRVYSSNADYLLLLNVKINWKFFKIEFDE